ncbi:hypothetical protein D3C85_1250440 [compost metagenome]
MQATCIDTEQITRGQPVVGTVTSRQQARAGTRVSAAVLLHHRAPAHPQFTYLVRLCLAVTAALGFNHHPRFQPRHGYADTARCVGETRAVTIECSLTLSQAVHRDDAGVRENTL